MRILAVDPGDKHLGIALSDPTGTIANPLTVIRHVARPLDAALIAELAQKNEAGLIVVGLALDEDGNPGFQARKAFRLADVIREQTSIPVELWDESESTREARMARIAMGSSRRARKGHMDELAATVILQTYIEAHRIADQGAADKR
jgi:putative Holliday junction resolvase